MQTFGSFCLFVSLFVCNLQFDFLPILFNLLTCQHTPENCPKIHRIDQQQQATICSKARVTVLESNSEVVKTEDDAIVFVQTVSESNIKNRCLARVYVLLPNTG